MTDATDKRTESAKPAPAKAPGANLIPSGLARQLAWFVLRLAVSYTAVAIAIEGLSPLLDVLIARTARNLLAFVSSPYYLKTIDWLPQGYAVTTWIGPLQDGFDLPSLSFVFAFAIGYVFALPGMFRRDYWLRGLFVIALSFFVCATSVAIVADARLSTALSRLDISMIPQWRMQAVQFLQYYLWMLTVRLYPLVMVILLTWESGAFREQRPSDAMVRRLRVVAVGGVGLLLAISLGFDSFANRRIETIDAEPLSQRIEALAAESPDIGPGLVKLAEHMHKGRNVGGALWTYRYALDHLEGEERRKAREAYDRLHEGFKARLLEDSKARRKQRPRVPAAPR